MSTPVELDTGRFIHLLSNKNLLSPEHTLSLASDASTPLYSIKTSNNPLTKAFDITLSSTSSPPQILGVVKLHKSRAEIGIGDPDEILDSKLFYEGISWETIKQANRWNYKEYDFEYGPGRKKYKWKNASTRCGHMRTMELREIGEGTEVLAFWRRMEKLCRKKGELFIGRTDGVEEDDKWEAMVILSILSIITAACRR